MYSTAPPPLYQNPAWALELLEQVDFPCVVAAAAVVVRVALGVVLIGCGVLTLMLYLIGSKIFLRRTTPFVLHNELKSGGVELGTKLSELLVREAVT